MAVLYLGLFLLAGSANPETVVFEGEVQFDEEMTEEEFAAAFEEALKRAAAENE